MDNMDNSEPVTEKERNGVREIRKKRLTLIVTLGLYLLAILAGDMITDVKELVALTLCTFFFAIFWAGLSLSRTKCPRCGGYPFSTLLFADPLTRRCLHCGLSLRKVKGP